MQEKSMVKSAFILTFGTVISRLIGVLYVFLFSYIVSSEGLALYTYAYIPYAIFLDLATLGIPTGITKLITFSGDDKRLEFSYFLYRKVRFLSLGLGIVMFLVMFFSSDLLATRILAGEESLHNTLRDVSRVIKLISLALLVIPNLSLLRGIFNSLKQTKQTAISQIVEQLVRVILILSSAVIIIRGLKMNYVYAIYIAVLAAGISGFVSFLMLYIRYNKLIKKEGIKEEIKTKTFEFDLKGLLKTLWVYSLPAVFITLILGLYNMIDTLTFNQAFLMVGKLNSEIQYATYQFEVHKLITLPMALGISLGTSFIVYSKDGQERLQQEASHVGKQAIKSFQTLFFIIIPIVVFLMVFHEPIYQAVFSRSNPYGPIILLNAAPLILPLSFIHVISGILQSVRREWVLILVLILGISLKYLYNIPLIGQFEASGAVLSTFIGLLISVVLLFAYLIISFKIDYKFLIRRLFCMSSYTILLGALFYIVNFYFFTFELTTRLETLIFMTINGVLFVALYLVGSYLLGFIDVIAGKTILFKEVKQWLNMRTSIKKYTNML